jgi:predicted MPP superfamily phosphohydrolase
MTLTAPRPGRLALLGAVAVGAPLVYAHLVEPRWLRVERWTVCVPDLPPAWEGMRVVHLTDFQIGMWLQSRRLARRAVALAASLRPELVLLTGDFVHYGRWTDGGNIFRPLTALAPAYAVLGNHDHAATDADAAAITAGLSAQGVRVLNNAHALFSWRGATRTIVGIDDFATGHADLLRAVDGISRGTKLLALLTHVPDAADYAPPGWFPLILAGHTHGSQVALSLPRPFSLIRLVDGAMRVRYPRGWYAVGDALLYVNRGIGLSSLPLRFAAPPEVALLVLTDGRALPSGVRWRAENRPARPSLTSRSAIPTQVR